MSMDFNMSVTKPPRKPRAKRPMSPTGARAAASPYGGGVSRKSPAAPIVPEAKQYASRARRSMANAKASVRGGGY